MRHIICPTKLLECTLLVKIPEVGLWTKNACASDIQHVNSFKRFSWVRIGTTKYNLRHCLENWGDSEPRVSNNLFVDHCFWNVYFKNTSRKQKRQVQLRPQQHRIDSIWGQYQTKRIPHRLNYSIYLVEIYLAFFQNLLRIHSRKKQKNDFMAEHIFVHCVLLKILSEKVYNIPYNIRYILQLFCNGQNF